MSDGSINPPTTSDNSLAPALSYIGNKIRVEFDGDWLEQDNIKITFTQGKTVNIYTAYDIGIDMKGTFSFPTGEFGKNMIIFEVDIRSSVHLDNMSWYHCWRPCIRIRLFYIDCRKKVFDPFCRV